MIYTGGVRLSKRTCVQFIPVVLVLLLAIPVLSGPAAAFGQEEAPVRRLSPDEAVDLAIKNNLSLESSRIGTDTKRRNSQMSWNQFIPGAVVNGGVSRDNKKDEASLLNPDPSQWHMNGSFSLSLDINAAMFENMRRLKLDYQAGLISFEKAKIQLERDIRVTYYDLLLLRENIGILQDSFATAQRQVEMSQENYRAGLVPELTLLQARVSMENLKPAIDEGENNLRVLTAQFAMNLGLPYDTRFEFIETPKQIDFVSLDVKDLISKAASGKPEIRELRQQMLVLDSTRRAKILSTYTPSFSMSWDTAAAFNRNPWEDSWSNSNNWNHSGSLRLGLSFKLDSLIPFSINAQGVKDLTDQQRAAAVGLAQAIQGTEVEIYNTVLSLEKTRITLEAQKLTEDLAERTYRLTEEAYRAGLREFLEVQNAELELRKARLGVQTQNFNYLTDLIKLEYAIGVPFGTLSVK
ncbi:MAG: TolC family protein [Treponema sp.]|jgi:outer membrane protein TolC|nr:TolC family protein [Treponema sp.]